MAARAPVSEPALTLALAGALVLLQLAAIWGAPFVPTQDGPVHLEIAAALGELWRGEPGRLGDYYAINPRPQPNLLSYLLLDGLAALAGWRAAERILLSACVALFAAAFLYCLGAGRRGSNHLLVVALPLAVSFFFHMGFLNFCLSLPLALLALGWWRRHPAPGWGATAALAAFLLLTTLAHAVAGAVTLLTIGVLALWRRSGWRPLVRPLLAGLPAAALLLAFVAAEPRQPAEWLSPALLLKRLALLQSLTSYDRREHLAAAAWGVLVAALVAARLARRRRQATAGGGGLGTAVGVLLLLYLVLPAGLAGGGYLNLRLQLIALVLLLVWLADGESSAAERRAAVAGGAAVVVALLVLPPVGLPAARPAARGVRLRREPPGVRVGRAADLVHQ